MDRQKDRQTDTNENITYPHSRVVIIRDLYHYTLNFMSMGNQSLGCMWHTDYAAGLQVSSFSGSGSD